MSNKITNSIKAGNSVAKMLENNQKGGVSQIDIMSAKKLLSDLEGLKPKNSGQKGALTRVVNRLADAIQHSHVNPNVRDMPGGPTHPLNPAPPRPTHPLNPQPPIIKIKADNEVGTGGTGGTGGVIVKIKADDEVGNSPFSKKTIDNMNRAIADGDLLSKKFKSGGFIQGQPLASRRYENVVLQDKRPSDGNLVRAFVEAGQMNGPKVDVNKATEFYLEIETARGGKKSWAGPFALDQGPNIHPIDPRLKAAQDGAEKFAKELLFPFSRSDNNHPQLVDFKPNKDSGGFTATYNVMSWDGKSGKMGEITADLGPKGELWGGYWTRGNVAQSVENAVNKNARALAEHALGHMISKSDVADIRGIRDAGNGKFAVILDMKRFLKPGIHSTYEVVVDKNGKPESSSKA